MPADETVNTTTQEYYCRLTDAGAALEAAAHAAARPVVLTHVAVGDGNGEVPVPEASASALVHEVYRRQIDGRERDKEDPNIAWLHVIIPADEGGFWIREFGIYAQPLTEGADPVLYAYGNHAPYYKQQTSQGQATTHELSIPVILSGTAEVEISVKDAGYASQLAFEDLLDTVESDRERLWENDGEGPRLLTAVLPLATQEAPGAVQPDGATTTVDENGHLSALGGHLLLNSEQWITESGTFTAPVKGWYDLLLFDGGWSGKASAGFKQATGGASGRMRQATVHLEQGQEVSVTIGAGGLPASAADGSNGVAPGTTHFGDISSGNGPYYPENAGSPFASISGFYAAQATGMGLGAGIAAAFSDTTAQETANALCSATGHWGGGGGAVYAVRDSGGGGYKFGLGKGAPGSVRARWHDPSKAAGPLPAPALLSARRMAPRAGAAPVTVNLYDPETGQGSVWREEDAEAKLAAGMITEAAWREICAARAAEERAAWLADPDTEAERFAMLRAARDAKLAATDYLVAPDYPLTDMQRAAVTAYRQALRDLPAQAGAPWDGGGEATPWPEMPEVSKIQAGE